MPAATVNIEVFCDECGEGLCNQTTFVTTRHRGEPSFRVLPCKKCLETAHDEGRAEERETADEEIGERDRRIAQLEADLAEAQEAVANLEKSE